MSAPKVGDNFPSDVVFTWIPPTPETAGFSTCGIPTKYNASESKFPNLSKYNVGSFANPSSVSKDKKIVIVAVPGAFTPTCSANHVPPFLEKAAELKAKGVDQVVVIAHNDTYVMSGWGKANKVSDEFVVRASVPSSSSSYCLTNLCF